MDMPTPVQIRARLRPQAFNGKELEAMKLNSTEWSTKFGVLVTDPDGWNRQDFDASWAEQITEAEFKARLQKSTSLTLPKPAAK